MASKQTLKIFNRTNRMFLSNWCSYKHGVLPKQEILYLSDLPLKIKMSS
uniref:Bm14174 n=1 Tax=Brugia malayi TaxID=6279 RepID=A0A1I9G1H8_BRUMA|nr:Bm14174 [Brugia malayi]